ncbi:TATA-box binding protein associated factor 11 like protein 2 [Artibeus jamaicensis]|uniref:TATA-box binding protein associated factor 11 like protein 2 n=1 Tax=Artibeus jamaicensis TaxID=9417 RepID=UPI00235ACE4A|nr:TATA-box binding protein associated factor 11 like protein 2 [Artibeus jamaicensis]
MNKAGSSPSTKAEAPGVCRPRAVARQGPGPSDARRIPADRLELQKTSDRQGGVRSPDDSDPRAGARKGSQSSPPAAKRLKRDATEKERKREVDEEDVQKMKVLMLSMSEEQLHRYEVYRRSAFPRATVKHLIQRASGTSASVPSNVVIAVAGLAKVFVGELVEEALDVCERWGETPPLQPKHLREAVRRLRSSGKIPNAKPRNILF